MFWFSHWEIEITLLLVCFPCLVHTHKVVCASCIVFEKRNFNIYPKIQLERSGRRCADLKPSVLSTWKFTLFHPNVQPFSFPLKCKGRSNKLQCNWNYVFDDCYSCHNRGIFIVPIWRKVLTREHTRVFAKMLINLVVSMH